MQEQTYRRVDVGVTLKVSPEGNVRPLTITFENGKTYTIDRLKERKRAAATKVGGTGEPASDILSLSKTVKPICLKMKENGLWRQRTTPSDFANYN